MDSWGGKRSKVRLTVLKPMHDSLSLSLLSQTLGCSLLIRDRVPGLVANCFLCFSWYPPAAEAYGNSQTFHLSSQRGW